MPFASGPYRGAVIFSFGLELANELLKLRSLRRSFLVLAHDVAPLKD
jgi:hypothetical protein